MQRNPTFSCLLAGLIGIVPLLPLSMDVVYGRSHTAPNRKSPTPLRKSSGSFVYKAGPTTTLKRGVTRGAISKRHGGYCGQSRKPVTALIPHHGVPLSTRKSANLWVALPPEVSSQGNQKFHLKVTPTNGARSFEKNYLVATTKEGLAKISIPPNAFTRVKNSRSDYDWQLTYYCPHRSAGVPIVLSGVIGLQPQTLPFQYPRKDLAQVYGEQSYWFDMLEALINPLNGGDSITPADLKSLLTLESVKLGNFYPELSALIFPKDFSSESEDHWNIALGKELESLTNSGRSAQNLSVLESSHSLNKAAQDYANIMAKNNCPLIHDCGGIGLDRRLKGRGIPTTFRAENLVRVPKNIPNPSQAAYDELFNSWSHRRNSFIPEWTEIGIGVAETPNDYYFVQIFNQAQGTPSIQSRLDHILPQTSANPRRDYENLLPKFSVKESISIIEGKALRDYAQHLGSGFINSSNSPSSSDISSDLSDLSRVTQNNVGIVYVIATEQALLLYLLAPEANGQPLFVRKTIPVSRREVLGTAQQFRQRITDPTHGTDFLPYAVQLNRWIMEPLQPTIDQLNLDTLLFTLDDGLRSIPIAALHDGQNFLIERYRTALIPTFGLTDPRKVNMKQQKILAMGITQSHAGLSALPAVKTEIEEISKLFVQNASKVTLNEASTVGKLQSLSRAQDYGIIHLATHAKFQPQRAGDSFLQFWNTRLALKGLGSLGRQLNWETAPVEMLVLSACTTAMGDSSTELGFAGSAVLAGVKSTVASLWNVNDVSSTAFMIDFYRNLAKAPTKTEAFRQTQLAMLRGQLRVDKGRIFFPNQNTVELSGSTAKQLSLPFSHPYYWAGHTVIGNWN